MNVQQTENDWESSHNDLIRYINRAVYDFKEEKISFSEYKAMLIGSATELEKHINFKFNLYKLIDAWLEFLEFCYLESDWYQYGLEIGDFILEGLDNFPEEVKLPKHSIVVKNQLQKFNDIS